MLVLKLIRITPLFTKIVLNWKRIALRDEKVLFVTVLLVSNQIVLDWNIMMTLGHWKVFFIRMVISLTPLLSKEIVLNCNRMTLGHLMGLLGLLELLGLLGLLRLLGLLGLLGLLELLRLLRLLRLLELLGFLGLLRLLESLGLLGLLELLRFIRRKRKRYC